MSYNEKIITILIMVLIIFAAPTFITNFIPRPFDWLIKLCSMSIRYILPFFVIWYFLYRNDVIKYFWMTNLLLIPQSVADSGVLWHNILQPVFKMPENFHFVENVIDLAITVTIAYCYTVLLIYSYIKLKKEFKTDGEENV